MDAYSRGPSSLRLPDHAKSGVRPDFRSSYQLSNLVGPQGLEPCSRGVKARTLPVELRSRNFGAPGEHRTPISQGKSLDFSRVKLPTHGRGAGSRTHAVALIWGFPESISLRRTPVLSSTKLGASPGNRNRPDRDMSPMVPLVRGMAGALGFEPRSADLEFASLSS
jgi:hypothetical protein